MKDNINEIEGKWEFNEDVTKVFGDMLSRSIPNYDIMRTLTFLIGRKFIKDGSIVGDIGCSNGLASEKFIESFPNANFILSDVSVPMLKDCERKYRVQRDKGQVIVLEHDLRRGVPFNHADLVISSLTIQFTPIEYRQNIIQSVYDSLNKGGAFILIEKVLGNSSEIDNILVDNYYSIKKGNGYTEEQIKNKRKSLEGVLVPLTSNFNEHLLSISGFQKIDCFWRCLNFMGWIAIK